MVLLIVPAHACCSYLRQLDKVKDRRKAHGMPCVPPLAVRPRNFNKDLASKVSVLAKMYASRPNDRTMDKYACAAGCTSCTRLAPVLFCLDFALQISVGAVQACGGGHRCVPPTHHQRRRRGACAGARTHLVR